MTRHTEGPPVPTRPVISRRLVTGFSVVGITALVMCGILLSLLAEVRSTVHSMRHAETSVRESLALAMAVREQYIDQAHTIIAGNHNRLAHYEACVRDVHRHAQALRAEVPAAERGNVDRVTQRSRELDTLFKKQLIPALERGDDASVVRLHEQAETLSLQAVHDADAIASLTESRMAGWQKSASQTSRVGLFAGVGCILFVFAVSAVYTQRIRTSVARPLRALARAARRVANGDFETRLDEVGEGEFETVALAFDKMIAEVEQRQARLVQTERLALLGQLAAGIAHEINNPIGVIRGYLRIMNPEDTARLREQLAILDDEAAACQRIAEDLVAYARAGELQCELVQVDDLLSDIAQRIAESGEAGSHAVELDVQAGTVEADPGRIRQLVHNLVHNAAQVSPAGTAIEIVGEPATGDGYSICVLDRGPGIPEADVERVFEPFFTKREGGSGIGLALCQSVVDAHGGRIGVDKRPGGGSVFRVVLPGAPPSSRRQA